ncbi:hypothetical protein D3C77_741860 [compost metagenome]
MRQSTDALHQRAIERGTEQTRQRWHGLAVLDHHIGGEFSNIVDSLAANVVCFHRLVCQANSTGPLPLKHLC